MIDKKTFKKSIGAPFERAGYTKDGQSWYLHGKDANIVNNLQKSNWGDNYYINIGIWLKAFGEANFPRYNQCHLYYRVESLFPEQREIITTGCSLELTNSTLLSNLSLFFEKQLIPFLWECTDEGKLKEFMTLEIMKYGMIKFEAKKYLLGENYF